MSNNKIYVSYDPITYEFLGFYPEGRKDMPPDFHEVNPDTYMDDIGNHNKYNPDTKTFFTDPDEMQARLDDTNLSIRNHLLSKSDISMLEDYPITGPRKIEMKQYRQALRDYPQTGVMPDKPDWFEG